MVNHRVCKKESNRNMVYVRFKGFWIREEGKYSQQIPESVLSGDEISEQLEAGL